MFPGPKLYSQTCCCFSFVKDLCIRGCGDRHARHASLAQRVPQPPRPPRLNHPNYSAVDPSVDYFAEGSTKQWPRSACEDQASGSRTTASRVPLERALRCCERAATTACACKRGSPCGTPAAVKGRARLPGFSLAAPSSTSPRGEEALAGKQATLRPAPLLSWLHGASSSWGHCKGTRCAQQGRRTGEGPTLRR